MTKLQERLRDTDCFSEDSYSIRHEAADALDAAEAGIARCDAVTQLLANIFSLLPPTPMQGPDGQVYEYHDPQAAKTLLMLRKRLDEGLASLRAAQPPAEGEDVVERAKATVMEAYADYWGLSGDELPDNCAVAITDALVRTNLLRTKDAG